MAKRKIDWTPEQIGLLGKTSDMDVATKLGVSHVIVCKKRAELGIPACHYTPRVSEWTADMDAMLGTAPDDTIAKQLGLTEYQVMYRRRKLAKAPAGKTMDTESKPGGCRITLDAELMAKINGIEAHLVGKYQRLGVPINALEPWQVIAAAIDHLLGQINSGKYR